MKIDAHTRLYDYKETGNNATKVEQTNRKEVLGDSIDNIPRCHWRFGHIWTRTL